MSKEIEDIKTFENPSGCWEHQGSYSVELTEDAGTTFVPASASVEKRTVKVEHGRIRQTMGGIQFYSREQPFYWDYKKIKVIRDGSGNLLWVNSNQR